MVVSLVELMIFDIGSISHINRTGTVDLGNVLNGIQISGVAQSNTIGGTTAGERNIISGNGDRGVLIVDVGTDNNVVVGNYIGTDVTGTVALGNTGEGVGIDPPAMSIGGFQNENAVAEVVQRIRGVEASRSGPDDNDVVIRRRFDCEG